MNSPNTRHPLIVRACLFLAAIYYVGSFTATTTSVMFPTSDRARWLGVVQAEDALYVMETAKSSQKPLPATWLGITERLHRENPAVLFSMADYAAYYNDPEEELRLLTRASLLNPHHGKYRRHLISLLINNKLYADLDRDISTRGFEGLNESYTSPLYRIGLDALKQKEYARSLLYWKTATRLSPSWSHLWIEYARLQQGLGHAGDAVGTLKWCAQDTFAGAHCSEALQLLYENDLGPPGSYYFIIIPDEPAP